MNTFFKNAHRLWVEITDSQSRTSRRLETLLGRLPDGAVVAAYSLPIVFGCIAHGHSPGRLPDDGQRHYKLGLAARVLEGSAAALPRPPKEYRFDPNTGALVVSL